jgi:hypothetical protein
MRKPSAATVIATVALFIALGGVAVAGNGDNLVLGKANTASKQTSLTGTTPNPLLRIENTSSDGNARAIVGVLSASAAAAGSAGVVGSTASTDPGSAGVVAQNTGGGPALKAVVNPGAAPLTVNSSTKVANLNADQLDGMSSSQFVQGGGSVSVIHETETAPPGQASSKDFPTLGGLVDLQGNCFNNDPRTGVVILLVNVSGTTMTLLREGSLGPTTPRVLGPTEADDDMPIGTANHFKWHGRAANKVFTIDTWTYFDDGTCTYDIWMTIDP